MLVTMKQTREAAPDGIAVVRLLEGETVDLPDDLAARYLERGIAVEVKQGAAAVEDKDAGAAVENKAGKPRAARVRKAV